MKRIISYIIILFCIIMLPVAVNAASASVGLKCPASAASGETISCTISVTSDVKVNGVVLNHSFTGASYVSFTPASGFTSNYASNAGFNIGYAAGKSGTYNVGTLKIKVSGAATVALKNIDISDVNFESYSSTNRSATIRLKSSNNKLSNLSLVGGTLSPAFNANTVNYTSTINANSVTINASKGDNYQTISGTGKKTLKYGKNTFKVVVKSEAGASKTYTIVITRPDNRKTDNYLKSLSVDKGTISFNKDTLTYSINVAKDITAININAAVNDSTAKFVTGYGPRTASLNYGLNSVMVKVQAENETIRTYTIKVNREDDRSKNNNLSSITLSEGKFLFTQGITEYSTTVPFDVTRIDVQAIPEDTKARVNISNPNLVVGENTILITVTAENETTQTYKIIVKRLSEAEVLSDNNNVSSIDILGHGIKFNPNTNEYDVNIGDEYALVIDVLLEDPNAKYVIEGNENLKDGSVIKITSTSESGVIKEYKLNIKKEEEKISNGGNQIIFGLIGFVLGALTMFVTNLLLKKSKSKKETTPQPTVKSTAAKTTVVQQTSVTPKVEAKVAPAPVAAQPAAKIEPQAVTASATQPVTQPTVAVQSTAVKPAVTTAAPTAKPVMQEANVSQPTSQTANVIPENK